LHSLEAPVIVTNAAHADALRPLGTEERQLLMIELLNSSGNSDRASLAATPQKPTA
jgi:hypothetical protein